MKLDEFLNRQHIGYQVLYHERAYGANRLARSLHVPGREVAKSVVLRNGAQHMLAVLPADHEIDWPSLRARLGDDIDLASEAEVEQLFPDCEPGAMHPFGSLYRLNTIVDEKLCEDDNIVFDAHTHEQAIRMSYRDFEQLEHPQRGRFARHV